MAHPNALVPGNCYFLVHYYDQDLLVPDVDTLIYRKSVIDEETGDRLWLFDDPGNGIEDSREESPSTLGMRDTQLHEILEIDGLLTTLKVLSDFHPLEQRAASRQERGISEYALEELSANIGIFIGDTDYCSLTVTILFTDNGLSLGRKESGDFEIGFFPHPKLDPERECRIVDFFDERGVKAHVDYLSDKGRTRVLAYPIARDRERMVDVSARVLREVHNILEDDSLEFAFLRSTDVA